MEEQSSTQLLVQHQVMWARIGILSLEVGELTRSAQELWSRITEVISRERLEEGGGPGD